MKTQRHTAKYVNMLAEAVYFKITTYDDEESVKSYFSKWRVLTDTNDEPILLMSDAINFVREHYSGMHVELAYLKNAVRDSSEWDNF